MSTPSSTRSSDRSAAAHSTRRDAGHGRRGLGHHAGFWIIAFAFFVAMAFSTIPAPLYVLYQQRDGFSSFMITLLFAVYAVGVAVSLFLAGHLSDWLGRRRILLPALLVEALAALLFVVWPEVPGLLVARFVTGLGVGVVTATATAHLSELHLITRPGTGRTRAELVSTAANLGGLGMGPLLGGLLAQFLPEPLLVPYLVLLALLLLSAIAVALVPETVQLAGERPAYRPQRVSVPAGARRAYFAAGGAGFAGFAVFGMFTSLAPSFVAVTMHQPSRAVAGAVVFLVFGASAAAQVLLGRMAARRQLGTGLTLIAVGLIPITVAVFVSSLTLFLIGGIVVGAGIGLSFKGAVSTVVGMAAPETRGEALAGMFLITYVGLTIPVLGLGIATQYLPSQDALLGFSVVVLAATAWVSQRLFARAST